MTNYAHHMSSDSEPTPSQSMTAYTLKKDDSLEKPDMRVHRRTRRPLFPGCDWALGLDLGDRKKGMVKEFWKISEKNEERKGGVLRNWMTDGRGHWSHWRCIRGIKQNQAQTILS